MLWGRRRGTGTIVAAHKLMERLMPQPNDLSRSLVALDQDSTIIAVVELSQSSWLVAGVLPGIERQPRKKLEPSPERLLAVSAANPIFAEFRSSSTLMFVGFNCRGIPQS